MNTIRKITLATLSLGLSLGINSCTMQIISSYEATAKTTYTWRVEYFLFNAADKKTRFEEFASTSIVNVNGKKPAGAFGDVDDEGLWWPAIPPKPSLDEIEARAKHPEKHGRAEILRTVEYNITYDQGSSKKTFPTNYSVYRQASKAYAEGKALKLTLGINDASVEKAEPQ